MAITASGLYFLTLEKCLVNTAAIDWEAETNKLALFLDALTPNFDTNSVYSATNEASGTGYTAGGKAFTGTEWTVSGGVATYDSADTTWPSSTIANAMAAQGYADAVADELMFLQDFVTAVSTTGGTFSVINHANGIATVDFTP